MKKTKISMPYKKGGSSYGIIPGNGNPKADDKQMLAKEGHVVPAENTPVAMNLVSMMGYDPMKNVAMEQTGGIPINISSGEYFMNKEQVAKLKQEGINPEMLSPNSPYNEGEESNINMDKGGKVKFTMPTQQNQNNNQQPSHGSYAKGGPNKDEKSSEGNRINTKVADPNKLNSAGTMGNSGVMTGGSSEQDVINAGFRNTQEFRDFYTTNVDKTYDFRNNNWGPQHQKAFVETSAFLAQNPELRPGQVDQQFAKKQFNTNVSLPNELASLPVPGAQDNSIANTTYPDPQQPGLMDLSGTDVPWTKKSNEELGINNFGPENYVGNGTSQVGDSNQKLYADLINKSKNLTDLETAANIGMGLWNLSRERQPLNKPGLAPVREITRDYEGMKNELKQDIAKQTASNAYTLRNLGNTNALVGLDANAKASTLEGNQNIWDLQQQDTMMNVNASNQNQANYTNQMYDWGLREADAASKFQQAKGANIAQNVNQIFTVQDAGLNKEAQLRTFGNEYDMSQADSKYDSVMGGISKDPKFLSEVQKKHGLPQTGYISRMDYRNNKQLQADIDAFNSKSYTGKSMASGGGIKLPSDLHAEKSLKDLVRSNFTGNSLLSLGQS